MVASWGHQWYRHYLHGIRLERLKVGISSNWPRRPLWGDVAGTVVGAGLAVQVVSL